MIYRKQQQEKKEYNNVKNLHVTLKPTLSFLLRRQQRVEHHPFLPSTVNPYTRLHFYYSRDISKIKWNSKFPNREKLRKLPLHIFPVTAKVVVNSGRSCFHASAICAANYLIFFAIEIVCEISRKLVKFGHVSFKFDSMWDCCFSAFSLSSQRCFVILAGNCSRRQAGHSLSECQEHWSRNYLKYEL